MGDDNHFNFWDPIEWDVSHSLETRVPMSFDVVDFLAMCVYLRPTEVLTESVNLSTILSGLHMSVDFSRRINNYHYRLFAKNRSGLRLSKSTVFKQSFEGNEVYERFIKPYVDTAHHQLTAEYEEGKEYLNRASECVFDNLAINEVLDERLISVHKTPVISMWNNISVEYLNIEGFHIFIHGIILDVEGRRVRQRHFANHNWKDEHEKLRTVPFYTPSELDRRVNNDEADVMGHATFFAMDNIDYELVEVAPESFLTSPTENFYSYSSSQSGLPISYSTVRVEYFIVDHITKSLLHQLRERTSRFIPIISSKVIEDKFRSLDQVFDEEREISVLSKTHSLLQFEDLFTIEARI
jgi:hypothetical protein